VGDAGGATLYVEGGPNTLYLMYDYWNSPNVGPLNHVTITFDSTELDGSRTTYAVEMTPGSNQFDAFEKPADTIAPEINGGFDLRSAPWVPLSTADLAQSQFRTALGFDVSPNSSQQHFIAEFSLSTRSETNKGGIYSPDPNFWSGSAGGDGVDPPFSSEIFVLNPDGSVQSTTPALGPNRAPVLQSQQVVPEPSGLVIIGTCFAGMACGVSYGRRNSVSKAS
jgi:hypothetical protein